MIVVADSSPLICLINIGLVDLLGTLFGEVRIPREVEADLQRHSRPQSVQDFIAAPPPWLRVVQPRSVEPIPFLHPGETAAIALTIELNADLLLIDEKDGREAARARRLRITGTIGLLQVAAEKGLVDLASAFDRIKKTDFWISPKRLDQELWRFKNEHGA